MPRYYFDIYDGESQFVDETGVEFETMDDAISEARRALADLVRDALRDMNSDGVSVNIRDGSEGPVMLKVTMTTDAPNKS